jgi:hypothetical protein
MPERKRAQNVPSVDGAIARCPKRDREHKPRVDDHPLVVEDDLRSVRQIVHHASDLLTQAAVASNDRFSPAQEVSSLPHPDGQPPENGGSRLRPAVREMTDGPSRGSGRSA